MLDRGRVVLLASYFILPRFHSTSGDRLPLLIAEPRLEHSSGTVSWVYSKGGRGRMRTRAQHESILCHMELTTGTRTHTILWLSSPRD